MSIKLATIDKQVIQHLKMNGSMDDAVGIQLTTTFIAAAMSKPEIASAANQFRVTPQELAVAYVAMIECLSNPTINAGGPMLAATLLFIEPFRLEAFMQYVYQEAAFEPCPQTRLRVIVDRAEFEAERIWGTHTAARGECAFEIDPSGTGRSSSRGCFGLFLAGAFLFLTMSYAAKLCL